MAGRAPPPSSRAPISRETVEVVRKKITAPAGPPPAGMTAFSAPKSVSSSQNSYRRPQNYDQDQNESFDDGDDYYTTRRGPGGPGGPGYRDSRDGGVRNSRDGGVRDSRDGGYGGRGGGRGGDYEYEEDRTSRPYGRDDRGGNHGYGGHGYGDNMDRGHDSRGGDRDYDRGYGGRGDSRERAFESRGPPIGHPRDRQDYDDGRGYGPRGGRGQYEDRGRDRDQPGYDRGAYGEEEVVGDDGYGDEEGYDDRGHTFNGGYNRAEPKSVEVDEYGNRQKSPQQALASKELAPVLSSYANQIVTLESGTGQLVTAKAAAANAAAGAPGGAFHSSTPTPNHLSGSPGQPGNPNAGKKLAIYNFQRLLSSTYRELKAFVMNPCPPGFVVRCYIERNRSGSALLAPYFSLCADLEDGTGRELMVCRKIMRSRSAHYVFSLKNEDLYRKREQRSRLFLGKLRATSATEYVLYDNGICAAPEDPDSLLEALDDGDDHGHDRAYGGNAQAQALARKMERDMGAMSTGGSTSGAGGGDDVSLYRKELAVIQFNSKTRPVPAGTRGMEVCVPVPTADGENVAAASNAKDASKMNLEKPFERIRIAGKQNVMFAKTCMIFHERNTRYDPLSSCLVYFKDRAQMASVKNFQLVLSDPIADYPNGPSAQEMLLKRDEAQDFIMQMGKTTEDCFNMDFKYPMSLLQCFAICIARFDAKLNW